MDNIENENEFPYYVMMSEPIPDMSVDDIRNWFAENNDEQGHDNNTLYLRLQETANRHAVQQSLQYVYGVSRP